VGDGGRDRATASAV